jgi:hypothetical protein
LPSSSVGFYNFAKKFRALKRLTAILLFVSGIYAGCAPSVQSSQEIRQFTYFSIAAVIDQQVATLSARRAQSRKIIQAGKTKPDTLAPQAIDWAQELQLFKEADINRPAWAGEYEVSEAAGKISYKAKKNTQPIRLLIVGGALEKPDYIEAHLSHTNLLFHTERRLQLQFKNGALATYRMEGYQKTFFSDTTRYSMFAIVN